MVMGLLKKLGNSDFVKNAVRKNTYIKNVDCVCESEEAIKENGTHGKNCFCELDYELFGESKKIYTNKEQPTFNFKVVIDPANFMKFADTSPLK